MTLIAFEAAVRSTVLIMLVWLILLIIRLHNPHRLKALWASVVVASFIMPLLMQIHVAPALAAPGLEWTIRPRGAGLTRTLNVRPFAIFVYLAPMVVLLWRYTFAWRRLWRIRREGRALSEPLADGLDVRVSRQISSPSTFGTTILLPEECMTWQQPKLAAVMAHERAHVLHRDCYVLWLARLNACVFWFNPLAWWLLRRLAALAEQTSDEAAVETVGNGVDYAEILLALRMRRTNELATAMASSDLPARIERILAGVALSPALRRRQLVLTVAAILPAVALAAAPLQRTATPSADSDQTPRVISWPSLEPYYPREAMHKGMDGMVELAITLDRAGRATDTQILREYPLDMGFGAAASELAHVMKYSNPAGQPVTFAIRVNFALNDVRAEHAESSSAAVGG